MDTHLSTQQRLSYLVRSGLYYKDITHKTAAERVGCTPKHLSMVLAGKTQGTFALWDDLLALAMPTGW